MMRVCVTGVAGFVGSRLARAIVESVEGVRLSGVDNLSRRGSESNLPALAEIGCDFRHGDVRSPEDLAALPEADWIVDCAAQPSVLAGLAGDSAALVGHNLFGTVHLLEKCRRDGAGFVMVSTSRVYSVPALAAIPLREAATRLDPDPGGAFPAGSSPSGIAEAFSTEPPISLYGATKRASEVMALEYGLTYGFPVRINRCGVLAGAGQFGRIDQGIVSFWIYQWLLGRPLAYIGFGGRGLQVRDFLPPEDLARLVIRQIREPGRDAPRVLNVGGGPGHSVSLRELSDFCRDRFGRDNEVRASAETRPFDIPYYATDNALVGSAWGWSPTTPAPATLGAIADWAERHRPLLEAGF